MDQEMFSIRNHVVSLVPAVPGGHDHLPYTAFHGSELNESVDFADNRRTLGAPGFEELSYTR